MKYAVTLVAQKLFTMMKRLNYGHKGKTLNSLKIDQNLGKFRIINDRF